MTTQTAQIAQRTQPGQESAAAGTGARGNNLPWQAYRQQLLSYISTRVQGEEAEDILQDVLLKAWQNLGGLADSTKLAPWLYSIARNAIVDHYRSRMPGEESFDENMQRTFPPEENRAERELAACLLPMMELLPEKYRTAVQMAELEGKKQHEIAASAGISLSGAKSRVQRGRGMLRVLLEDCCRIECNSTGRVTDYHPRRSTGKSGPQC